MSRATTALLTDRYELTMLEASLESGAAHRDSVFEVFSRRLSGGRRYGVVAGTGRVLDAIADFTFSGAEIDWLREAGVVGRSEEHTSELQSRGHLVCRLLLETKKAT